MFYGCMKHGVPIVAAIFLESNDLISFFSHFFNIALIFFYVADVLF